VKLLTGNGLVTLKHFSLSARRFAPFSTLRPSASACKLVSKEARLVAPLHQSNLLLKSRLIKRDRA
jgi:hypothetical protein